MLLCDAHALILLQCNICMHRAFEFQHVNIKLYWSLLCISMKWEFKCMILLCAIHQCMFHFLILWAFWWCMQDFSKLTLTCIHLWVFRTSDHRLMHLQPYKCIDLNITSNPGLKLRTALVASIRQHAQNHKQAFTVKNSRYVLVFILWKTN